MALAEDFSFSNQFVRLLSPSVRAVDTELEIHRSHFALLPNPELFYRSDSLGYLSRRLSSPEEPFWVEVDLEDVRVKHS